MKSIHKLTLDKKDIREAIRYWLTEKHGLLYVEDMGDRTTMSRYQLPITVTLKDEL